MLNTSLDPLASTDQWAKVCTVNTGGLVKETESTEASMEILLQVCRKGERPLGLVITDMNNPGIALGPDDYIGEAGPVWVAAYMNCVVPVRESDEF